MTFDIRKKDDIEDGRKFSIELSLSGLIGFCATLVLGLIWVFIFGILVGRNYQPSGTPDSMDRMVLAPDPAEEAPDPGEDVLRPEDLGFYNDLQDTGDQVADATPAPAVQQPSSPEPEPSPAPAPQPAPAVEPEPAPAQASEPAAQAQPEPQSDPIVDSPPEDDTIYSYRYQVASFKDLNMARAFVDKVASVGLTAEIESVENSGQLWHRVIVLFQGKPVETRDMKDKLRTLGVDKPLLNSKIPI